jgi:hypothetical protein
MNAQAVRPPCQRPIRRFKSLDKLLDWYCRWVRVREARYQYLVAILDGTPIPSRSNGDENHSSGEHS